MKGKHYFAGCLLAAVMLTGCSANKNVPTEWNGNREIDLPCAGYDRDSEKYFTGMGIGENVNMQNSRSAALDAAKSMLQRKIGGLAKGLTTSYSKTMSGNANQDDVSRIVEGEIAQVIDRMLNDVEQVCEKMYQTPGGTYQSHIAIRISKKDIAESVSSSLSKNEKLRMEFDRDNFRKFAEEYMKKLAEYEH